VNALNAKQLQTVIQIQSDLSAKTLFALPVITIALVVNYVLQQEPVWNAYQVVIVLIPTNRYVTITNARVATIIAHLGLIVLNQEHV